MTARPLTVILLTLLPTHTAFAGEGADGPFRVVPIGLCEDYPEETTTDAAVRRDMALLEDMGVRHLRVSVGWDDVEPADDDFDWSRLDAMVNLAREHRVKLLPYVCYTPEWASSVTGDDFWSHPPSNSAEFGEFMRALASRYRDDIDSWEIWNEPDNADYWSGSVADYAELLRAGSAALREADPTAKVVSGGIANDPEFLRELFEAYGAAEAVDVVNVHAYFETWSPEPLEHLPDLFDRVSTIVARHGDGEELWAAEVGYSSFRDGAIVSGAYDAAYNYEHTADFQADGLIRTLALLLATEKVTLVAWYELRDLPPGAPVIGDENNRHLGVIGVDGRTKPAAEAFRFAGRLFRSPYRRAAGRLTSTIESDVVVHVFERPDAGPIVVAWLRTNHRGRPIVSSADERIETIDLRLSFAATGDAVRYDARGRELERLSTAAHGEVSDIDGLKLRGGETAVIVLPPK